MPLPPDPKIRFMKTGIIVNAIRASITMITRGVKSGWSRLSQPLAASRANNTPPMAMAVYVACTEADEAATTPIISTAAGPDINGRRCPHNTCTMIATPIVKNSFWM